MTKDPFERHGLTHLSPSSLRMWRDAPAAWVAKHLMKVADEGGPKAWRGLAVEAGVDRLLFGVTPDAALQAMFQQWDNKAQGVADDDAVKEYEALSDFLVQAGVAYGGRPIPLQRQHRVTLELPGVSVPYIGYCDWLWQDCGSDLKTTWKIPGKADPAHVEQVAAYSLATGVPFDLTYVSPKRWVRYEVSRPMADAGWDRVLETALAIRSFLAHVDNAHDALSMIAPDYDSYYFTPPMIEAVRAAKAVRVLLPGAAK